MLVSWRSELLDVAKPDGKQMLAVAAKLVFVQVERPDGTGPVRISVTHNAESFVMVLQGYLYDSCKLLAVHEGNTALHATIAAHLRPHWLRNNWYAASPEVLEVARTGGVGLPRKRLGGAVHLRPEQVLEVFRLAHGSSQSHEVIGLAYNVSRVSVGKIARAQVYPELLERVAGDGARVGEYFVRERGRLGAPLYRLTVGKRGEK